VARSTGKENLQGKGEKEKQNAAFSFWVYFFFMPKQRASSQKGEALHNFFLPAAMPLSVITNLN